MGTLFSDPLPSVLRLGVAEARRWACRHHPLDTLFCNPGSHWNGEVGEAEGTSIGSSIPSHPYDQRLPVPCFFSARVSVSIFHDLYRFTSQSALAAAHVTELLKEVILFRLLCEAATNAMFRPALLPRHLNIHLRTFLAAIGTQAERSAACFVSVDSISHDSNKQKTSNCKGME